LAAAIVHKNMNDVSVLLINLGKLPGKEISGKLMTLKQLALRALQRRTVLDIYFDEIFQSFGGL
jgi:hypothetical protein